MIQAHCPIEVTENRLVGKNDPVYLASTHIQTICCKKCGGIMTFYTPTQTAPHPAFPESLEREWKYLGMKKNKFGKLEFAGGKDFRPPCAQ